MDTDPAGVRGASAGHGVVASLEHGVLHIELDRAASSNALDMITADGLRQAVDRAGEPGVRAVLITARGKNFCVGGDIQHFAGLGAGIDSGIRRLADSIHGTLDALATQRAPVVCAVRGWCAGAGIGLAVWHDVVVASETVRFRSAYTGIGLTPDMGLTWLLPQLVGRVRARDMVLTNRVVDADTALAWGLVSRVVPDDALEREAWVVARALADGPPDSQAAVRELFRRHEPAGRRAALDEEARLIAAHSAMPEGVEGVRSFLASTSPAFRIPPPEARPSA